MLSLNHEMMFFFFLKGGVQIQSCLTFSVLTAQTCKNFHVLWDGEEERKRCKLSTENGARLCRASSKRTKHFKDEF